MCLDRRQAMTAADLEHLPSDQHEQRVLLRILCHVAQRGDSVTSAESRFVETVAEKMGYGDWEFPEGDTTLRGHDIAELRFYWKSASKRIWLATLLRNLAAADGIVCDSEESFLDQLTSLLFASSSIVGQALTHSDLEPDERKVVDAARKAADSIFDTRLWHRKTGKVVGAAFGVETPDGLKIFTGANFELSQPTGSRCAEQTAIGSALADQGDHLGYSQVTMIAVAAGQQVENPIPDPLPPCGVCCEMIHKINKDAGQIQLYLRDRERPDRTLRLPFSDYYPPRFPSSTVCE